MKFDTLTKKEFDLMTVFWNTDEPLSLNDISKDNEDLNRNTVQVLLKKLLSQDFIEVAAIGYSNTVLTRKYVAKVTQAQYLSQTLSDKASLQIALDYIKKVATPSDIEKIEKTIEKRKTKLI